MLVRRWILETSMKKLSLMNLHRSRQSFTGTVIATDLYNASICRVIKFQPNRAFNELSEDILSHTVSQGRLKRGMLDTEGSYVLDAGVELFLWLGKAASVACRGSATELLAVSVHNQSCTNCAATSEGFRHRRELFRCTNGQNGLQSTDWQRMQKARSSNFGFQIGREVALISIGMT